MPKFLVSGRIRCVSYLARLRREQAMSTKFDELNLFRL
jgi:hypothetical protein